MSDSPSRDSSRKESTGGFVERWLDAPQVFFQLTLVVFVAAGFTLWRVHESVTPPPFSSDPTPLGYTWSLLLFVLPLTYLVVWLVLHPEYQVQRKAFLVTLAILLPTGFLLDFLFANTFFVFPNAGAVLGIEVPGSGGGIPIEEFVFYLSGFLFVLLLYIWTSEVWMGLYTPKRPKKKFERFGEMIGFHGRSVLVALGLLALAVIYKKFFSDSPEGFPWYWTYLLAAAFVPSAGFFRTVKPFVNWRAFSFTFLLVLLISLLWEATLASPYGWWGYQADAMMGLFLHAWSGLPIEAVFVWLAVTYTTVIVYEVVVLYLYGHGRGSDDAGSAS